MSEKKAWAEMKAAPKLTGSSLEKPQELSLTRRIRED
jgi:hypothetical protein